ncbi:hypothetical protein [Thiolapillus sp.]
MFPREKKPLRAFIQDIPDQAGKVYVCKLRIFAQKIRAAGLMNGASIQGGDIIMSLLADPDVKVVSF